MAKTKNKEVKKASEVLNQVSQNEKERMHYLSRLIRQIDEQSLYNSGVEAGKEQGIEQGIEKSKIVTVKKMLEKGMSIETIMQITDLSKEEISKYVSN